MHVNTFYLDGITSIRKHNQHKIESGILWHSHAEHTDFKTSITGIAYEFARLRNDNDIVNFANTYGLLGLHPANIYISNDHYFYMKNHSLTSYTFPEAVAEWNIHVNHIRKLLKLHRSVADDNPIEDDLIQVSGINPEPENIDREKYFLELESKNWHASVAWGNRTLHLFSHYQTLKRDSPTSFAKLLNEVNQQGLRSNICPHRQPIPFYYWSDNLPTLLPYTDEVPLSEEGYHVVAKMILWLHLEEMLKHSVHLDFNTVGNVLPLSKASELKFTERRATYHLLTAIYHDVWRIVNQHEGVGICDSCDNPFPLKRIRKKGPQYCSKKCNVRKWRENKSNTVIH